MEQRLCDLMDKMDLTLKSLEPTDPSIKYYEDRAFMPKFSWESVRYACNEWEIPENSVFISSYWKTGTLWGSETARQILCAGNDELLRASKFIPFPFYLLELGSTKKFEIYPHVPVKVFRTHIPADIFNFEKIKKSNSKIIYMYRNPKDQIVSWYHFANKSSKFNEERKAKVLGKDWNEFFRKYTAGEHPTGMPKGQWYPDHVKGWLTRGKEDENILPVEYESLKRDFSSEVKRMAKFLGIELSEPEVETIKKRCSVDAMKSEAAADKSGFLKANIRKGEVGGWKDQLTVSQSEFVDQVLEEKLAGTGIKFTFEL